MVSAAPHHSSCDPPLSGNSESHEAADLDQAEPRVETQQNASGSSRQTSQFTDPFAAESDVTFFRPWWPGHTPPWPEGSQRGDGELSQPTRNGAKVETPRNGSGRRRQP